MAQMAQVVRVAQDPVAQVAQVVRVERVRAVVGSGALVDTRAVVEAVPLATAVAPAQGLEILSSRDQIDLLQVSWTGHRC